MKFFKGYNPFKRFFNLPGEVDLHWDAIQQLELKQKELWNQHAAELKHLRSRTTSLETRLNKHFDHIENLVNRLDRQSEIQLRDTESLNMTVHLIKDVAQTLDNHGDRIRNLEKRMDPPAILSNGGRFA